MMLTLQCCLIVLQTIDLICRRTSRVRNLEKQTSHLWLHNETSFRAAPSTSNMSMKADESNSKLPIPIQSSASKSLRKAISRVSQSTWSKGVSLFCLCAWTLGMTAQGHSIPEQKPLIRDRLYCASWETVSTMRPVPNPLACL